MVEKRKNIAKRVAEQTGLKPGLCYLLIRTIRDQIMRELQVTGECHVKGFGVFKLKLGERTRVTFKPAPRLLYELREDDFIGRKLASPLKEELVNAFSERSNKLFFKTLAAPRSTMSVTRNFIYYLKNHFPFDKPWEHPETKKEYYPDQVKEAIEAYQQADPRGYVMLWSLWVSIDAREQFRLEQCMDPYEIIEKWYRAVGSVLFILLNPELTPARLKETPDESEYEVPKLTPNQKRLDYYLAPFKD